jgi:thymidine kinase
VAIGKQRGRLELLCGCMFAGKTTKLIERLDHERVAGRRVIACKHARDNRYAAGDLATHDGRTFPCRPIADGPALEAVADDFDVIGVDEAHFFGWPLIEAAVRLRDAGRHVILVGLDHDVWGRDFPFITRVKRLADAVRIIHWPCRVCGEPARYSQRMTPLVGDDIVGGPEAYEARCGRCFEPLTTPAPPYAPDPFDEREPAAWFGEGPGLFDRTRASG